jgi:DNA adenine methylase
MLRYAGGKTRAKPKILPYIPDGDLVSPFLGGGSLELELAKTRRVYAGDVNAEVVNWWTIIKTRRQELRTLLPPNKDTYHEFKRTLTEGDELSRAVKFYYVNRCCFSACMTGGYSGERFTPSCLDRLEATVLGDLEVECCDYEVLLQRPEFAYLDPPYDVPNLYLSGAFDHERLAKVLTTRENWLLSYNDTPRIRTLYADCEIIPVSWSYGMTSKAPREILIRPRREA